MKWPTIIDRLLQSKWSMLLYWTVVIIVIQLLTYIKSYQGNWQQLQHQLLRGWGKAFITFVISAYSLEVQQRWASCSVSNKREGWSLRWNSKKAWKAVFCSCCKDVYDGHKAERGSHTRYAYIQSHLEMYLSQFICYLQHPLSVLAAFLKNQMWQTICTLYTVPVLKLNVTLHTVMFT